VIKRIESSRSQGSYELPSRGQTDAVVVESAPAAADAQATRSEAANVDPAAARDDIRTTDIDVLEQPFASGQEVADDRVDHYPGGRRLLILGEKSLLLVPGLAG